MKYLHERLITNSHDVAQYMIEQINSFNKDCGIDLNVHLTFYDMNGQSTTTICYNDNSLSKVLPGKMKTVGMISEDLLGYFMDRLLDRGYSISNIGYDGYNISICLEPNLSLTLSFPSKNNNSLLLKDYFNYIINRYSDIIKEVFDDGKKEMFINSYQKELFFNSLSREDLLYTLRDMDDEDLCYLLSFVSDEQYRQIIATYRAKTNNQVLVRKKAI